MSSDRKIQSARANGAKSRGPKTPEGRAKSARNAITHGLNSGTVVLQNESKERFLSLRQAYIDQLAPRNQIEADLVDQLVVARWRLERAWSLETSFLDLEMARQRPQVEEEFELIDEPTRTALAFKAACDGSSSLALLNRYEIRYQRTIHRTLEALRRLRESEKENLPNEPNPISEHKPEPPAAPLAAPPDAPPATPHNPQPTTHHRAPRCNVLDLLCIQDTEPANSSVSGGKFSQPACRRIGPC